MRSRLNCIVLCDFCVHSFTVWYLLFPRCLHLTISCSFCRIHSLADPCFFADRLPYLFVGWSVVLCRLFTILSVCWTVFSSDRLPDFSFSLVDPYFSSDRLPDSSFSLVDPYFSSDHLPFAFAADRLSFLIVCRLFLPLIVCRSWSFAVCFCRWSFVIPNHLPFSFFCWLICIFFAADRLSYSFVADLCSCCRSSAIFPRWLIRLIHWLIVRHIFFVGWSVFLIADRSPHIFVGRFVSFFDLSFAVIIVGWSVFLVWSFALSLVFVGWFVSFFDLSFAIFIAGRRSVFLVRSLAITSFFGLSVFSLPIVRHISCWLIRVS